MEPFPTFVLGLDLTLTATEDGGRRTPLVGGHGRQSRFVYGPNWGLPNMTPSEQSGAPILGFSRTQIAPGEAVRAVIVPVFPDLVPMWAAVTEGCELTMYEGASVCGVGHVLWRVDAFFPLSETDESRFLAWLDES